MSKAQSHQEFSRMAYAIAKDLGVPYLMRTYDRGEEEGQGQLERPYVARLDTFIPRFFGPSETISLPLQYQCSLEAWFPMDASAERIRADLWGLKEKMDVMACEYLYGVRRAAPAGAASAEAEQGIPDTKPPNPISE